MADNGLPLKGFTPAEALWRLLRLKGYEGNIVAFQDAYPVDGSAPSMIAPLEAHNVQARAAIVRMRDLRYLEAPTLLQLKDQSWVLAHGIGKKRLLLESPGEKDWGDVAQWDSLFTGLALDLSAALPEGKTLWRRIKTLLGIHKKALVQAALASVMLQLLALAMPEITGAVMDRALPDGAGSMLNLVTAGVLLVAAFQAWTGWLRDRMLLFLATRLEVSAERGFLEHLLRLPFPFLQKKTLGEMLQAFGGLTIAREVLVERACAALLDGSLAASYLVVMGFKLPGPTVVVALMAGAMATLAVFVGRMQAKIQAFEVDAQASEQGYLTELISGVGTLKAAGAEAQGLGRWMNRFRKELMFGLRKNRIGLWSEVGLVSLKQTMTVALLIWGGNLCLSGGLRIGTLFAFMQLSSGFLEAVFGVVNAYLLLAVVRPQLAKTQEILAQKPEPRGLYLIGRLPALDKPVIMEDVWFRYSPDGPWILKAYNLEVKPGQKFILTGSSGSGKSTVLRLLAGLYAPEKGTISIGGIDPRAARQKVVYLPQFVQLYGGSIIENLRVLSCDAPTDRLVAAAQRTGLHELVATLPMNYNTLLPHGGKTLSGGQRQLIALTAAIASNRPLAVLDEAAANLDAARSTALMGVINGAPWTAVMASHAA